jgi:BA14K-like protein
MSFVVYLAVILVAAASALFGLDLLTAPLPPKPPAQVAATSAPNKLGEREAQQKQQADTKVNRAQSPVVRVNPMESKDVRMVHSPPAGEATGASRADSGGASVVSQQPRAEQSQQPIQPVTTQTAAVAPEATPAPNEKTASHSAIAAAPATTAPAAQQAAGRCNVQACAGAYSSFRAADCTYQPFSGPRRVCGKPSAQKRATASVRSRALDARAERLTRSWDARRNPEVDDAVRGVRRMPSANRDDDADIAGSIGSRRTILIDRGGRSWP